MHRLATTLLTLFLTMQMAVSQTVDHHRTTPDTARLRLCYEIADESNEVDTVAKYALMGIQIFSGGDSIILARLHQYYGWSQSYNENYDEAITHYKKAVQIYERHGEYKQMSICYNNLSICYNSINDYPNIWKSLYNGLKSANLSHDTSAICNCYNEITSMYIDNNMFVQAQETAFKSLRLGRMTQNFGEMGNAAALLSQIFNEDDSASIKAAIQWSLRAEKYIAMMDGPDSYYYARMTDTYGNLITLYTSLYELTGKSLYADYAAHYYDKLVNYIGNNDIPDADLWILVNSIQVKYSQEDYDGAMSDLRKAQKETQEKGYTYYNKLIYEYFYKIYHRRGDYHNALKYLNLYKEINRSKINAQAAMEAAAFDALTSVEQESEFLLNEQKMADAELASARRHYTKTATAVGIGIAAVSTIIIIIFLMLHNARKTNDELSRHSQEIKTQNAMILNEKEILANKHKKILQSMTYARRIQMATLCSDTQLLTVFPTSMTYYRPRELVSGDWYWASSIGRKKLLAVGGSARHGVPGALVCMMTLNALKDTIGQLSAMSSVSPSAILRTMQAKLPQAAQSYEAGVSICLFVRSGIRFAGIHQNAMLITEGQPVVMHGDKPNDTYYPTEDGDYVVVYSASTKRELLNITDRPEEFCAKMSLLSPEEQRKTIDNVFLSHRQSEDITAVTVKITQS